MKEIKGTPDFCDMKMMGMSTHGCGVDKRQKHHVGEDKMKMRKSDISCW